MRDGEDQDGVVLSLIRRGLQRSTTPWLSHPTDIPAPWESEPPGALISSWDSGTEPVSESGAPDSFSRLARASELAAESATAGLRGPAQGSRSAGLGNAGSNTRSPTTSARRHRDVADPGRCRDVEDSVSSVRSSRRPIGKFAEILIESCPQMHPSVTAEPRGDL